MNDYIFTVRLAAGKVAAAAAKLDRLGWRPRSRNAIVRAVLDQWLEGEKLLADSEAVSTMQRLGLTSGGPPAPDKAAEPVARGATTEALAFTSWGRPRESAK